MYVVQILERGIESQLEQQSSCIIYINIYILLHEASHDTYTHLHIHTCMYTCTVLVYMYIICTYMCTHVVAAKSFCSAAMKKAILFEHICFH